MQNPCQQSRSNCPRTEAVLPHITSQLETHSHLLYNVLYIGEQRSTHEDHDLHRVTRTLR